MPKKSAPAPPTQQPSLRRAPDIPQRQATVNPLDGVTFKLAENVVTSHGQQNTEPGHQLQIKQYDDILAEHFYDFAVEQKALS